MTTVSTPQVMHVYVHGKLGAGIATEMQEATNASIANGLVMVVHLQAVQQVTAAGLGVLMGVRRQLLENGLSLSLAGLNFKCAFCSMPGARSRSSTNGSRLSRMAAPWPRRLQPRRASTWAWSGTRWRHKRARAAKIQQAPALVGMEWI